MKQIAKLFAKIVRHVAEEAKVDVDDVRIEYSVTEPQWAVRVQVKARKNAKADQAMGYSADSIDEAVEVALQSVEAFRKIHAEDKARARRVKGK